MAWSPQARLAAAKARVMTAAKSMSKALKQTVDVSRLP
jgi:hypothetical protein